MTYYPSQFYFWTASWGGEVNESYEQPPHYGAHTIIAATTYYHYHYYYRNTSSYYNYWYNFTAEYLEDQYGGASFGYDGLAQDASNFVGKGHGQTATRISTAASVSRTIEVH